MRPVVLVVDFTTGASASASAADPAAFIGTLAALWQGQRDGSLMSLEFLSRHCNDLRGHSSSFAVLEDEEQVVFAFIENLRRSVRVLLLEDRAELLAGEAQESALSLLARRHQDFLRSFQFQTWRPRNPSRRWRNPFKLPLAVEPELVRVTAWTGRLRRRLGKRAGESESETGAGLGPSLGRLTTVFLSCAMQEEFVLAASDDVRRFEALLSRHQALRGVIGAKEREYFGALASIQEQSRRISDIEALVAAGTQKLRRHEKRISELEKDSRKQSELLDAEIRTLRSRLAQELADCRKEVATVQALSKADFEDYCKSSVRYASKLIASHSALYLVLLTDLPPLPQR